MLLQHHLIWPAECSVSPLVLTYRFPARNSSLPPAFCNIWLDVLKALKVCPFTLTISTAVLIPTSGQPPILACIRPFFLFQTKAFFFFYFIFLFPLSIQGQIGACSKWAQETKRYEKLLPSVFLSVLLVGRTWPRRQVLRSVAIAKGHLFLLLVLLLVLLSSIFLSTACLIFQK